MMKAEQRFIGRMQPSLFGRTSKSSSDILSSLKSIQIANALGAKTQPATIYEFRLGNELLSYSFPLLSESHLSDRPSASDCYLIFEGRVRLLCQNMHLQRQVSADLLEVGAVFGADHLFSTMPLPYRVVAASPCRIVKIPYPQLIVQLEQLPQLHKVLSQAVQQRERLIFFKCFTQQRSLPNHTLKYGLLPQLIEHRIDAGSYLPQSLLSAGYFWLRAGQILNQSNPEASPRIGDGWGYPDAVSEDWIAQTDSIIYALPFDAWKTLDLLHF